MKIIALEGLDKSGKATQTKLLTERLIKDGLKVYASEFHRYDTPTGELIMKWLTKEWDVDQATVELIMSADKQAQQKMFAQLESDGIDVLVLDRYTLSQVSYGSANGMDLDWIVQIQKFMRKPDIDIIIDIPAEVSMIRKGKHNNGENDRYESNCKMLNDVRINYKYLSTAYSAPKKRVVDGERTIEEIHCNIYQVVQNEFDLKELSYGVN